MKWPFWRMAPEALLVFVVPTLGVLACEPDNSVKAGPPVLVSLTVSDQVTGAPYDLTDDGSAAAIPGFVKVTALFDRLLDPTNLVVIDPDAGADLGSDAATITASPGPTPPWTTIYTENGAPTSLVFAPGPNLVIACTPTFPSGATVTVMLDKNKLHSKANEPFTGAGDLADGRLTFETQPFAAVITVPTGDGDADGGADGGVPPVAPQMQPVVVAFNNLPSDTVAASITVTVNGAPFTDVTIAVDSSNSTMVDVTPNTTWPASAAIVVKVDTSAMNAVMQPLAAVATATFTTTTGT